VDAAEAPASEDKPAEAAKAEEVVGKDAKSPKKSPAKAKKEESAVDEPTVKKGRAKKEKKEDAGDDGERPPPQTFQGSRRIQLRPFTTGVS